VIPPLDDSKAWIEWVHRTVAALSSGSWSSPGLPGVPRPPRPPSLLWPSIAAVALVGFQAWLGRETVRLGNSGESVTAHLAAAMTLSGCSSSSSRGRSTRRGSAAAAQPAVHAAGGARARLRFALLLFGSHVTATASGTSSRTGR
jgi:heme A synthase